MIIYRISSPQYSDDLSGTGAKLFGARWNSKGVAMLYCTASISLALLEMLVHTQFHDYKKELDLMYVSLPDNITVPTLDVQKLKSNWIADEGYSRFVGDEFIRSNQNPVLRVPSAVVQEEFNYLLNPQHPEFKKIKLTKTRSFRPDKRLFSID